MHKRVANQPQTICKISNLPPIRIVRPVVLLDIVEVVFLR